MGLGVGSERLCFGVDGGLLVWNALSKTSILKYLFQVPLPIFIFQNKGSINENASQIREKTTYMDHLTREDDAFNASLVEENCYEMEKMIVELNVELVETSGGCEVE